MELGAEKPGVTFGSFVQRSRLIRQIGQRIARVRQERGWSRPRLARELGISRQLLANWERGENRPPYELFVALRSLFGVSIDELIAGGPPEESGRARDRERIAQLRKILDAWESPADEEEEEE